VVSTVWVQTLRVGAILAAGYGLALIAVGLISELLIGIGGLTPAQASLGGLILAIPVGALASLMCWMATAQIGRAAKQAPQLATLRELHRVLARICGPTLCRVSGRHAERI
jgi:hypothetical protein